VEQAFRPFNPIENLWIKRVEQAFRPFNPIENLWIKRVEQAFRPALEHAIRNTALAAEVERAAIYGRAVSTLSALVPTDYP
jgi:hypothetical protein